MLEKLKLTEEKYNDIAEKLMNPDIINDTKGTDAGMLGTTGLCACLGQPGRSLVHGQN